ncbi:AI-2E family transporter, partial [Streptococcus agalactiae]|nr:AI-2E family transporter [Streptococcus agalactiae]
MFKPVFDFLAVLILPLVISGLLYYLLKPMVTFLEKRGIKRVTAILSVFTIIILLLIWAMSSFIPMMSNQLRHFMEDLPSYVNKVQMETSSFIDHNPWLKSYKGEI